MATLILYSLLARNKTILKSFRFHIGGMSVFSILPCARSVIWIQSQNRIPKKKRKEQKEQKKNDKIYHPPQVATKSTVTFWVFRKIKRQK